MLLTWWIIHELQILIMKNNLIMGLKLLISSRKMDFGIMSSKAPKTQMSIIPHNFGRLLCQSADSAVVSESYPSSWVCPTSNKLSSLHHNLSLPHIQQAVIITSQDCCLQCKMTESETVTTSITTDINRNTRKWRVNNNLISDGKC